MRFCRVYSNEQALGAADQEDDKEVSLGDGKVVIQSDLRAHCSPSRQKNIKNVAVLLAKRIATLCVKCQVPGWGRVDYERGVKCLGCGEIKPNAIKREILGCTKCEHRELGDVIREFLDPSQCDFCNP